MPVCTETHALGQTDGFHLLIMSNFLLNFCSVGIKHLFIFSLLLLLHSNETFCRIYLVPLASLRNDRMRVCNFNPHSLAHWLVYYISLCCYLEPDSLVVHTHADHVVIQVMCLPTNFSVFTFTRSCGAMKMGIELQQRLEPERNRCTMCSENEETKKQKKKLTRNIISDSGEFMERAHTVL